MSQFSTMQPYGQTAMNNINVALQYIGQAASQLINAGQMSQQEYAVIYNQLMANQATRAAFSQGVYTAFGEQQVSPQAIFEFVLRKLQFAVGNLRRDHQTLPTVGLQSSGFGAYTQQPMPVQQPLYSQPPSEMSQIYGSGVQTINQASSPYPTPTVGGTPVAHQQHPPTPATPARQHTGAAYEIDITEPAVMFSTPKWVKKEYDYMAKEGEISFGEMWRLEYENNKKEAKVAEVKLEDSYSTVEGAVADLVENHKELFEGTYGHIVTFNQMILLPYNYNSGKKIFDNAVEAYSNKGPNELLRVLNGAGAMGGALLGIALSKFNDLTSVNFLTSLEDGRMSRIEAFDTANDLSRLLTDSGQYEEWKSDKETFKDALTNCIRASFGRIFRRDLKGYLDVNDPHDRLLLMSDERAAFRFSDGSSGRTIGLAKVTEELQEEVKSKVMEVFPLLVERRILLHNFPIDGMDNPKDFGLHAFHGTTTAANLLSFFARYGSLDLVSIQDPTTFIHPIAMGVSYQKALMLRRI